MLQLLQSGCATSFADSLGLMLIFFIIILAVLVHVVLSRITSLCCCLELSPALVAHLDG